MKVKIVYVYGGKFFKFGKEVKIMSIVLYLQLWLYCYFSIIYGCCDVKYEEFKFEEFVVGYGQIFLFLDLFEVECFFCFKYLVLLMYFFQFYEWQVVLSFYGVVLLEIECGLF